MHVDVVPRTAKSSARKRESFYEVTFLDKAGSLCL